MKLVVQDLGDGRMTRNRGDVDQIEHDKPSVIFSTSIVSGQDHRPHMSQQIIQ